MHNLAANSITSQMEPERTTHAKVLFKKENRYFANVRMNWKSSIDMKNKRNSLFLLIKNPSKHSVIKF